MPESSPEEIAKVSGAEVKAEESQVAATTNADAKAPAESSTAEPKGEKDLVASVKEALEATKEKSPDSETEGSQSAEGTDKAAVKDGAESETDADDLSEEELARLKPKTRKRIENLNAEKFGLIRTVSELEPKAQQFDQVVRFVESAGLTTQEVNDGFDIMAALKNDPLKAWEKLKPIVAQLRQIAGEDLPEDLHVAVNQGQITEAHARELAVNRSRAAVATHQLTRQEQAAQERNQRETFHASQQQVSTAVAKWENSKGGSDPDWKPKSARVMELVELETLRRERADPNFRWTPDDAVKFADTALAKVNAEFKHLAPRPKAVTPITDVASSRSTAKPTSAVEAAKQGLARMSAG